MIKILHIVAGDLSGGAARGALCLHQELKILGIDSKVLTNSKITQCDDKVFTTVRDKKSKFINMLRSQIDGIFLCFYKKRKKAIFSLGIVGYDFIKTKEYKEADIVHLHWINDGFVNIKKLAYVDKPIVWTMRDMWPMTGGCHVAEALGCNKYKFGCGECTQLGSSSNYDLSKIVLNRKIKYFPKNIKFVGISNWLSDKAKESFLLYNFDVRTISNNINTNDFFMINKELARKSLGFETSKKVVLCGSADANDFYKGFEKFLDAVKYLDKNNIFLIFFGNLELELVSSLGFEYKSFGYLNDNVSLRLVYSASDVFVAPSLMEAFGKTLAESMACGTPVVCFDATGPKDIVDHKQNGYKAVPFDVCDLAKGIEWVLDFKDHAFLSANAYKKVMTKFDSKVVAQKYIELYRELV